MRVVGQIDPELLGRLALADKLATIGEALRLGDVVDVIVQDEFTHDVVVNARAHAPAHLVFDTT